VRVYTVSELAIRALARYEILERALDLMRVNMVLTGALVGLAGTQQRQQGKARTGNVILLLGRASAVAPAIFVKFI
jgi:hypothetical protein